MRALLLNDTRSEQHVGCSLVMENTLAHCRRARIDVVATIPHDADPLAESQRRLPDFDVLLINGEGTMHDDRPAALKLGQAAHLARRSGKRAVLFNTVWQNNQKLNQFLEDFDLRYCRESMSAEEMRRAGHSSQIVPDLVFATEISDDLKHPRGNGVAVLDSVRHRVSLTAAWTAVRQRFGYLPLSSSSYLRLQRNWALRMCLRWRGSEALRPPGPDFLERLARYQIVVSPRFHGACLGLLLGKTVIAVDSNTHKLEGLYRDIGLNSQFIFEPERLKWLCGHRTLQSIASRWAEHQPQVQGYLARAPYRIAAMFDEIAGLGVQTAPPSPSSGIRSLRQSETCSTANTTARPTSCSTRH